MAILSCGLGLLVAETGVRLMCKADADGNRYFGNLQLKPYHLPVIRTRQLIDEYKKSIAGSTMIYDAGVGWAPNPGAGEANRQGFNSTSANPEKAHQDNLRIEIFGASYNRGWRKDVENQLSADGMKAEVFDFGVGGYGLDQAYLRWKKQGQEYHPDIVVLGYCLGTIFDNINMLRLIRHPHSGLPFAKPRFVLSGTGVDLINVPTPEPDRLAVLMSQLEQWPLLHYESFYHKADYANTPLRNLMLYALIEAKLGSLGSNALRYVSSERTIPARFFRPGDEPVRLALELVKQFRRDVESRGGKFFVVNLPTAADLAWYRAKGSFPYSEMYASMQQTVAVIKPEDEMIQTIGDQKIESFFGDGHYRRELQAVVGRFVASAIAAREKEEIKKPQSAEKRD